MLSQANEGLAVLDPRPFSGDNWMWWCQPRGRPLGTCPDWPITELDGSWESPGGRRAPTQALGRIPILNEFIILLQNAAAAGWAFLWVVALLAVGMLVFDRKRVKRSAEAEKSSRERMAA